MACTELDRHIAIWMKSTATDLPRLSQHAEAKHPNFDIASCPIGDMFVLTILTDHDTIGAT
jgi:hypothetical protein